MPIASENLSRYPFMAYEKPLFFAHRGGALTAPENTLAAFQTGAQYGAQALELDIQLTSDNEIVVIHDPVVDRTTNGTGSVASFTYAELRQLDAGYRFTPDQGQTFPFRDQGITIPALREVFDQFPSLRINIDLKADDPHREHVLWTLIQEYHASERIMIGSETHPPIARFRQLTQGRVATSASTREVLAFLAAYWSHTARWLKPAFQALQVPETQSGIRIVSPATIQAAHRLGIDVHVWTVNERADMERLISWGVDGLMVDRPDNFAAMIGR